MPAPPPESEVAMVGARGNSVVRIGRHTSADARACIARAPRHPAVGAGVAVDVAARHGRSRRRRDLGGCDTASVRIPPARAARLTEQVLESLPPPPARVLEVGFAGIHAEPLRLAGY